MQREIKAENGKQDKYLEKDNTFLLRRRRRRRKRRRIFGEGKIYFFTEEKEKWESIWRRKIKNKEAKEKNVWRMKIFFCG